MYRRCYCLRWRFSLIFFFFFNLNNIQTRSLPQELQRLIEGAYFEYTKIWFYQRS